MNKNAMASRHYFNNSGLRLISSIILVQPSLILLCHFLIHHSPLLPQAAGTSGEGVSEGGSYSSSEGCDRVWDVAFGPQGRIARVLDNGKRQMSGSARRGEVVRGESSAFRRSGIRKRRCTAWRGGGSRASLVLRNVRARPLV